MNYSSGVWGLASLTVAHDLPTDHVLWVVARALLDAAGGLFLCYLLAIGGLTAALVLAPQARDRAPAHRAPRRRPWGGPR